MPASLIARVSNPRTRLGWVPRIPTSTLPHSTASSTESELISSTASAIPASGEVNRSKNRGGSPTVPPLTSATVNGRRMAWSGLLKGKSGTSKNGPSSSSKQRTVRRAASMNCMPRSVSARLCPVCSNSLKPTCDSMARTVLVTAWRVMRKYRAAPENDPSSATATAHRSSRMSIATPPGRPFPNWPVNPFWASCARAVWLHGPQLFGDSPAIKCPRRMGSVAFQQRH